MRVLGIVTARGGSKGIPRKNIVPLRGKPLLAYTAEAALAAKRLKCVVLSTDDEEIAAVGRACGLEVPFMRPPELAFDDTPTIPVLQDVVRRLEAKGERYDAVLALQPTNPLRRPEDIDGAIELLERTGADSVISFVDAGEKHPARMKFVESDGRVIDPPFAEASEGQRRQDLPRLYLREGSIYLTRRDVLMEQNSLKGQDCRAWIVPEERACNIDTPFDLFLAEQMLRYATLTPGGSGEQPDREQMPVGPLVEGLSNLQGGHVQTSSDTTKRVARSRTILVTESRGFSPGAEEMLRRLGKVVFAELDRGALLRAVAEAEVLWVRLAHRIDAEVMNAAPRLQVIVTPTTGLNHIDLEEARRRGVNVLSLTGETEFLKDVRATAELTIALILALLRRIPAATVHVASGGWDRDVLRGRELHGKTGGVVGYGRLGRIVARYLEAFGMRVLATDPKGEKASPEGAVRLVELSELLRESDIVTLHVNLSEETRNCFGRKQFETMKPGAWFVNTARGELVDEAALLDALRSGRLAGVALDVLSDERATGMGHHPAVVYAREHGNLLITPHIGGCTEESMEKTELFLAEKLCAVL